jgi:predicted DsbA family dithiol-disulfide isomerase
VGEVDEVDEVDEEEAAMAASVEHKIRITVWSDYVCPFCYLEEPVFERLRQEYGEMLEIDWRPFELRPEPAPTLDPDGEYLHRVWNQSVYPMARQRGMTLQLPPVQPRSRRAMELAEYARSQGRFDDVHQALFQAFFEHGKDLDDLEVLTGIAGSLGLDRDDVRSALQQGRHRERVIEDQRQAAELGVRAVPTMVIGRADQPLDQAEALSGALPYELVRESVERMLQPVAGAARPT